MSCSCTDTDSKLKVEGEGRWRLHDPNGTSLHHISRTKGEAKDKYTITITAGPKTDWWTSGVGSVPESAVHRWSGPVIYQSHRLARHQDWKLTGIVTQPGSERFQQTTLFIRRNNTQVDQSQTQCWLKAGIENEAGRKYVG